MTGQKSRVKPVKEFYNGFHEERDEQGIVYLTDGTDILTATIPFRDGLRLSYKTFLLLKELAYEDGFTDATKGPGLLEYGKFIETAVNEKIENYLKDHQSLGKLYSNKLQKRHNLTIPKKEE